MRVKPAIFRCAVIVPALWLCVAHAQEYPSKPIRIVVPVAAGGSPDVLARLIGEKMRERMGQPVVVDNRVGAGQMIGSDHVAKSAPDGYTILLPTATFCGSAALQPKLPFDPVNDLTGVAMVGVGPLLVVVHPSVPAKNIKELIALAKSRAGQINYGSAEIGRASCRERVEAGGGGGCWTYTMWYGLRCGQWQ